MANGETLSTTIRIKGCSSNVNTSRTRGKLQRSVRQQIDLSVRSQQLQLNEGRTEPQ
jgi:hypothetical protein